MPVGVFDSGLGGLTVLEALRNRLPDVAFTYFGDNANAPYGDRSEREILDLTLAGVRRLFARDCHLVLLACNTAAAVALRPMQDYFVPADRRVLGVLVPVIEAVTGRPWADRSPPIEAELSRVLFFGTPATVASNAVPREVALRARGIRIVQIACPGLVSALEQGDMATSSDLVASFVRQGLQAMPDPQSVILGCTHYPLVAPAFAAALPPGTQVISQAQRVADGTADYLARNPEFAARGRTQLLTSGDPLQVRRAARLLLGQKLNFTPV